MRNVCSTVKYVPLCSTENGKRCRGKSWIRNMMLLAQVKQYVLILSKGIQTNLDKILVKQCVAISLTAIIYDEITNINA